MLSSLEITKLAVKALDDKKAVDIEILKTDKVTVLADYFIICTSTSDTHAKTLADETDKLLSEAGEPVLRREGYRTGGWTLLDFGCVIVHIFSEDMRSFYALDRLWSDAEKLDYKELLQTTP
ncbi:MAG: ribosome silencing factor [Oscillospiraceae bacterium]|nr:ribosome silencing factor [Oscillospiraceae bacterium]